MRQEQQFSPELHLLVVISEADQKLMANELDRLYAFQDRVLTPATKAMLVRELCGAGLPIEAILHGIQQLMLVELDRIKLPAIMAKAREFMNAEKVERIDAAAACDKCFSGYIQMVDEKKRQSVLACSCERGVGPRRAGLIVWNGENLQRCNGRMLKIWQPGEAA